MLGPSSRCLPGHISRQLDWKAEQLGLKPTLPGGMLPSQEWLIPLLCNSGAFVYSKCRVTARESDTQGSCTCCFTPQMSAAAPSVSASLLIVSTFSLPCHCNVLCSFWLSDLVQCLAHGRRPLNVHVESGVKHLQHNLFSLSSCIKH